MRTLVLAALLVTGCADGDGPVGRTFLVGRQEMISDAACPRYGMQDTGVQEFRVADDALLVDHPGYSEPGRVAATVVDAPAIEGVDPPNIVFTIAEHWWDDTHGPEFPSIDWTLWASGDDLTGHAEGRLFEASLGAWCVHEFEVSGTVYR